MELIMLFFVPLATVFMSFPAFIFIVISYRNMISTVKNNHDLSQLEKALWIMSVIVLLPVAALAYYFVTRPAKPATETTVRTAPYVFAKQ